MEEILELKQLLIARNYERALVLVEELEEMGKAATIRNIERFLILLFAHIIKHQAEDRMTNSWRSTIVNCVVEIQKLNIKDNKTSWYIKDFSEYLEEAYDLAILEAAIEAFGGIYSAEQLETKFDRILVIKFALELLEMTLSIKPKLLILELRKKLSVTNYRG
jgi:hypothetical protein